MIKSKPNYSKKKKQVQLSFIVTALVVVVSAFAIYFGLLGKAGGSNGGAVIENTMFTFDPSRAPGWWQGATNETSMVVFGEGEAHGCFVSLERREGSMSIGTEMDRIRQEVESGGQHQFIQAGSRDFILDTLSGVKQYSLQLSNTTISEYAEPIKAGQAFGFVPIDEEHYVQVKGICDTYEQLEYIDPALQAFSLNRD